MKKLLFGLFAALMMATGLVGVSAGGAQAACPYTGCVDTTTSANGPSRVTKGEAAEFCVRVGTGGEGRPRGTVTMNIARVKGHFAYTATKPYHGKRCFGTPALNKLGFYRVRFHFEGKGAYGNSNDWTNFRVRRG